MKDRDIAAINGTWQTIAFLNFYLAEYEDNTEKCCTIILYEMNEELQNVCKEILNRYGFIDRVIYYSEIGTLEKDVYANLWIGKLFSRSSKFIINSFPNIPVILFEEGLHSYIKQRYFKLHTLVAEAKSVKGKLKMLYKYFFEKKYLIKEYHYLILPSHEKRCKKKYFLLPLYEGGNSKYIVSSRYIYTVLENSSSAFCFTDFKTSDKPRVLVTGQCFSNYNLISSESELDIYRKIIQYYLNKGFEIFWKGHPRDKIFSVEIKREYGERINYIDHNLIPLEILVFYESDIELCGVSSSALLYKSPLFHGQARQVSHLLVDQLNRDSIWYKDFYAMLSLVNKNVPKLCI